MKSGMLAAEAIAQAIAAGSQGTQLDAYEAAVRESWIGRELKLVQNAQPLVSRFGNVLGTALAGADMWMRTVLGFGIAPTMKHDPDAMKTTQARFHRPIAYPKPDGIISFDRLTNVAFSSTNHEEDQPGHLRLADPTVPVTINLHQFAGLEARYCPAGVYEFVETGKAPVAEMALQINAQNCLHCKTCDIKDPGNNITWLAPEGGGGPNYPNM